MAGAGNGREIGRAERIRLFREELDQLEIDRVLSLTDEQRWRLRRYHESVLRPLLLVESPARPAPSSPTRAPATAARPSVTPWALTAAAWALLVLGAAWLRDLLPFWAQAPLLTVSPLALAVSVHLAARRQRREWIAPLALSASASLATNVVLLSAMLGVPAGAPLALAFTWSLLCAYVYDVPLLAAAVALAGAVGLAGCLDPGRFTWTAVFERPERLFPAGLALLLVSVLPHRRRPAFPAAYRFAALATLFIPMALLCNWGDASWLPVPPEEIQSLYRALGATAASLTAVVGLWKRWRTTAYAGVSFLALFVYSALVSWWWHRIPDYAFFSGAGLLALAASVLTARLQGGRKVPA